MRSIIVVYRVNNLNSTEIMPNAFSLERDAQNYIETCKKQDDRHSLSSMKYNYYMKTISLYDNISYQ